MKALFVIITLLIFNISNAQSFEIRLNNVGSGTIIVEMRVVSGLPPSTNNALTDLIFDICWTTTYNINLTGVSSSYAMTKSGGEVTQGSIESQSFYATNLPSNFPANWTTNQWVNVMTISNNQAGSGTGTFELCGEINIGIDLVDYTPNVVGSAEGVSLGSVLPVRLLDFSANVSSDQFVDLNWKVADEENFKHYEIERAGAELNFSTLFTIPGVGSRQYKHRDLEPFNGINYYRLKMVDWDGSFKYSLVKPVEIVRQNFWRIFPNPSQGKFWLEIESAQNQLAVVAITDSAGKKVYQGNFTIGKGLNQQPISIDNLPAGTYQFQLSLDGFTIPQSKSFVLTK